VGIDLPFFTRNRQDREAAAAASREEAAEHAREDALRQLVSGARLNHHDVVRITERLRTHDDLLLPQARQRADAAASAWRAGAGSLASVLDARRAVLEARMTRLELEADRLEHTIQLTWLGAFDAIDAPEGASP
ncbi:MAG TPA: TolC family protein, partial [Nevskiaceae bacterium]|nr:TolC family protein [Nevskiaceae bacterium]